MDNLSYLQHIADTYSVYPGQMFVTSRSCYRGRSIRYNADRSSAFHGQQLRLDSSNNGESAQTVTAVTPSSLFDNGSNGSNGKMSVDKYIFCLEERKKRCGTFSGKRAGVRLLEKQAASKGELFVQFIYAIAAAVGFAYVSVLIFTLATGNREPLTEHPGLTAFLCLLSGISLANLCRHQSPRFWKIADLVWIVTFVPSLAMTVLLNQQEENQQQFNRLIENTVEANIANTKYWKVFSNQNCSTDNDLYVETCAIIEHFGHWFNHYGSTEENYSMLITGNVEPGELIFQWDGGAAFYGKSVDRVGESELDHIGNVAIAKLNVLREQLGLTDLILPERVTEYGSHLVAVADAFSIGPLLSKLPLDIRLSKDETALFHELNEVYSVIASVRTAKLRLEYLVNYYTREISVKVTDMKFIPLMLASFVFPFRVGKSIFEIAAKKEIKNAPVSS